MISSNLLNDDTYQCICAGNCVIQIRTNRARCALYKKILGYSTNKAFLEKAVVGQVYKLDEKSYRECLKGESIAKV